MIMGFEKFAKYTFKNYTKLTNWIRMLTYYRSGFWKSLMHNKDAFFDQKCNENSNIVKYDYNIK